MTTYDSIQPGVNQTERNRILNRALTRQPDAYLSKIKLYGDIAIYDTANTSEFTLNTIDANEVIWVVSDIDGWWNISEPEMPDLPRGWGDGSYDAIGRYRNRIMTLNGSFLTQSPEDAPVARQALLQALNPMIKNQGASYLITTEFESSIAVVDAQEGANAQFVTYTTGVDLEDGPLIAVGDRIVIEGIAPSDFNKAGSGYLVTAVSDNTVTVDRDTDGNYTGDPYEVGGLIKKITKRLASKVRLSGTPIINNTNARGRHDFSIGLKATDPIKYEFVAGDPDGYATESASPSTAAAVGSGYDGSMTLTNSGDIAVPIIVEIDGLTSIPDSTNRPTITNATSDQSIIVNATGSVASGHKLEIDTYNREVLDVEYVAGVVGTVANGRSKVSVLIDWIYLDPGSNTIELTNFPSGSTVTIYYRSGWMG
jgi:hypothetical protein